MLFCGRFDKYVPNRNRLKEDADFSRFMAERGLLWDCHWAIPPLTSHRLVRSVRKYGGADVTLDAEQQRDLDWARTCLTHEFRPHMGGCGIRDVDFVIDGPYAVDFSRSPGFPWNVKYRSSADAWEEHEDWLRQYTSSVLSGSRQPNVAIFNLFPKEELLPKEKVAAGKLRSISGCPLEFKLLANSLFLDQNNGFYRSHGLTASEVGINPYNGGWDRLYHKLAIVGPDGVAWRGQALDVSAFDCSYSKVVSKAVYQVRFELLPASQQTQENWELFEYARRSIFEGYLVSNNGEVLLRDHGNSSGSPNTVVDNTLGLRLGFLYAYKRACRRAGIEPSHTDLLDNHRCAMYGDDNTYTCSPEYESLLSEESLRHGFAELGWNITSETNGWVDPLQLVFLQRCFHRSPSGLVVPRPLDGIKALDSMRLKGHGDHTFTYSRACSLLLEHWYHLKNRVILSDFLDGMERRYFSDGSRESALILRRRLTPSAIETLYAYSE